MCFPQYYTVLRVRYGRTQLQLYPNIQMYRPAVRLWEYSVALPGLKSERSAALFELLEGQNWLFWPEEGFCMGFCSKTRILPVHYTSWCGCFLHGMVSW
jgi:hypothetical protein